MVKADKSYDFKSDLDNSLQFQLLFLGLVNRQNSVSIKNLVSHLNSKATFLGMPCLTMLSSDLVIGRDFCSALALSMCLKNGFKLVCASLKRLNSFLRIKEGNLLSNVKVRDLWYIETKNHMLFPGLDMSFKKEDFEKLMCPKISEIITSEELHQNSLYMSIYQRRNCLPLGKDFDYTFYSIEIDRALENELAEQPRQIQITAYIKFHLCQDKVNLAKYVALGYTHDNYNQIYHYFTA